MNKVLVNNCEVEILPEVSLTQLLQQLGYPHTRGLAVAVNGQVIPKTRWNESVLIANDKITLIKATQGG
jgi:sulfur carrier protein